MFQNYCKICNLFNKIFCTIKSNNNTSLLDNVFIVNEKAVELVWNIETKLFGYKSLLRMLSELSSVYDLFRFITAFLLQGRRIIQVLCQKELGWDEIVPDEVAEDSDHRI